MSGALLDIIKERIAADGPIDVGTYMDLAIGHPEHGYYVTRDPLGEEGDFTTSPEISQIFGELVAIFFLFQWEKFGRPDKVTMLECGPGKGTLMADMLRVFRAHPEFLAAVTINFVEISPVLRKKQAESVAAVVPEVEPVWYDDISTVADDALLFVVGNEFLDVLPLRQFVRSDGAWLERFVDVNENAAGGLAFTAGPSADGLHERIELYALEGEIFEVSPARERFTKDLCALMEKTQGTALMIDYGHVKSGVGDTFQALRHKTHCHVLDHVGDADLTSHVDFEAVRRVAEACGAHIGATIGEPTDQASFLKLMHIDSRKEVLKSQAGAEHAEMIEVGYRRLTDADQMGSLFKVIEFGYGP